VTKTNSIGSRNDFYKCLAFMALAQQGKAIDEKILDNYVNRGITCIVCNAKKSKTKFFSGFRVTHSNN
jgi:hypothetical protein